MATSAKPARMKPFLFERSFDDRGAAGAELEAATEAKDQTNALDTEAESHDPEPALEVVHTEEEMTAARQDAYMNGHADGFREGYAEAMDTLEKQLNDLLEQLAPLVSALGERQAAANDRAQANMARIVQVVMERLMPVYVREHGHEEALAVVSDCLGDLQDPGRLTIHLSEETAELLGDRLSKAARKAGFEGQIRLLADEEMGASDVKVDWGAGGAERRYETIREEIDAAIDRAVERIEAAITGDPDAEMDSRTEALQADPGVGGATGNSEGGDAETAEQPEAEHETGDPTEPEDPRRES